MTSDVPAGAIVVGVPAKVIRYRDELHDGESSEIDPPNREADQTESGSKVRLSIPPVKAKSVEIDTSARPEQSYGMLRQ